MNNANDFLAVGLSPAIQKTLIFDDFKVGEVNRSISYLTDAAGKCSNTCRVLVQGGAKADCLTVAGKENRLEYEALCRRDSINITTVETSGRVRTCTTIVEKNNNRSTEIVAGEPELITADEETEFRNKFIKMVSGGYKAVIISGSRLAGFSDDIIPFMVEQTKKCNIALFADYRGQDLRRSFISTEIRPDYVKINEEEFYETFGEFDSLEAGLLKKSREYNSAFIISRGAKDTVAVENDRIYNIQSKNLKAVNPIGCGDSMTAGIAQGVINGSSLKEAVEKGRDYAARNVMSIHPGWILED